MSARVFVAVLWTFIWHGVARAQLVPLGGEFQVNAYTTSQQVNAAAASDASGRFVVVWHSYGSAGTDTSLASVQGQRFDAAGAPLGPQFQVNSYTSDVQGYPSVASDAAGNFVVVWRSKGSAGTDTDSWSIQGRLYDATGAPVGGEFQVNTYTTGAQGFSIGPAVASDPAGNFTVVWHSEGSSGSDSDSISVQGRRYDATGTPVGGQFQINTYTTSVQSRPAIASDAAGGFVVVFESTGSAGSDTDSLSIQARRYDATGAALGPEFQVNTYTTSYQAIPSVATDAAGGFAVVWESPASGGSDTGSPSAHGRRYDATGAPLTAEFQVNTYTSSIQRVPTVASDAAGNFLVVWHSWGSQGSDTDASSIQGQRYDAAGAPVDGEFQVNTYTTNYQYVPRVAADAAGNFVVVWQGPGGVGSDSDFSGSIHAQRYAPGRPILGKKLLVKDPTGDESRRTVVALGKETATDVGATVVGDPTSSGATLRVITRGATDSDQTYLLGSSGWSAAGAVGYKYTGPTDVDGDPVKKVLVKRTPAGAAVLKVILKGRLGTQSLDVQPPNPGDDGGVILSIGGGGTYCALFGGGAGGTEVSDTGQLWKVTNATGQGCPAP